VVNAFKISNNLFEREGVPDREGILLPEKEALDSSLVGKEALGSSLEKEALDSSLVGKEVGLGSLSVIVVGNLVAGMEDFGNLVRQEALGTLHPVGKGVGLDSFLEVDIHFEEVLDSCLVEKDIHFEEVLDNY